MLFNKSDLTLSAQGRKNLKAEQKRINRVMIKDQEHLDQVRRQNPSSERADQIHRYKALIKVDNADDYKISQELDHNRLVDPITGNF